MPGLSLLCCLLSNYSCLLASEPPSTEHARISNKKKQEVNTCMSFLLESKCHLECEHVDLDRMCWSKTWGRRKDAGDMSKKKPEIGSESVCKNHSQMTWDLTVSNNTTKLKHASCSASPLSLGVWKGEPPGTNLRVSSWVGFRRETGLLPGPPPGRSWPGLQGGLRSAGRRHYPAEKGCAVWPSCTSQGDGSMLTSAWLRK